MLEDSEIAGILASRKEAAESHEEVEAKESRDLARCYFNGEPFGEDVEVEGRSQVVLTDVRDKINGLMPSLMKVFTSGDKVVTFRPNNSQDVDILKVADRRVNSILMEENNGFSVLYTWFFDALLEKNGIVKAWREEKEEVETETALVAADTLAELETQEDIEVDSEEEGELFRTTVKRKKNVSKTKVDNVAPENFGIMASDTDIEGSSYCYEKATLSRSDLIDMGFDQEVVERLPTISFPDDDRRDNAIGVAESDDASSLVEIIYHYAKIDIDEDGVAERWKIVTSNNEILDKEEWNGRWPYFDVTPAPRGHEFYGISLAEEVMDLQLIKSTIMRQILDNAYGINNNRVKVFETSPGMVNMDDVLNQRVGGVIRIKGVQGGPNDVVPFETVPIVGDLLPIIGVLDEVAEVRTGVSKNVGGLDPNLLHKTPATTANLMMTAAQEKQALIARIFAETGVKHLFKYIYQLEREHGKPGLALIQGQFTQINPSQWPRNTETVVNVGLGTGNKAQQAQNIMALIALMEKGGQQGMVSPANMFNAAEEAVDALGYRHVERFFTDPQSPEGQQLAELMKPQPDPTAMMAVQVERERVMMENQIKQAELALQTFKIQAELGMEQTEGQEKIRQNLLKILGELQLKWMEITGDHELEGMELGTEAALKREEMRLQARLKSQEIDINTNIRDPNP